MSIVALNLAVALIVSGIGFGFGFAQGLPAQTVLLYTAVSVAVIFWLTNYIVAAFENRTASRPDAAIELAAAQRDGPLAFRSIWSRNRILIIAMALLLLVYLIPTAPSGLPHARQSAGFPRARGHSAFAFKISGAFLHGRSAFIGLIVLVALIVISSFTIKGSLSPTNIKAVLLFASFLGIACVGQTLVALLGGLDLSIPFVIGASNIGLSTLSALGPTWLAFAW